MKRTNTTIVGLGLVTALFCAIMSMFYLQQIPTKADLERLEDDMRRQHGLYLAAAAPIDVTLIRPEKEGERSGIHVVCTMRPDLRQRAATVELYLGRMADSILKHPDWRGKIAYVTVEHQKPVDVKVTRKAAPIVAKGDAANS